MPKTQEPAAKTNPLLGVFDLLTQHQKVTAALDETKKARETAEAELSRVSAELAELKASLSETQAEASTSKTSLAQAIAERDAARIEADKVAGLESKLSETEQLVSELRGQIKTVNQGVQAALEQVGFDASALPAPISSEATSDKDVLAESLYQKAVAAKSHDERRKILAEAKTKGIDLIEFAKKKEGTKS